jgi:hypothetical protein
VDRVLVENAFGGYDALAAELQERGYAISKSSLHRYGKSFEERLGALRSATEQAKAIVAEVGDEEGATNEALLRLVQERIFGALTESDPEKRLGMEWLPELAKAIGNITRASVQNKTYARAVRKEDAAKLAALEAQAKGDKKSGLDAETLRYVREKIYGF